VRRAAVLAGVALAVGFAGVTASSAATTSASPKQHAAKRLSLLVKHTRELARRLVKERHKRTLGGERRAQEHLLYHLLGDPSAQAWVSTPVRIDISKINVELIPIPTPDPGGPVFRVHVDMGDQGIATPTVVTLHHQGDPVGRGGVAQGAVDITPEVAVGRSSLTTVFEQDKALPAEKAIPLR
jgi:hypothetical protein